MTSVLWHCPFNATSRNRRGSWRKRGHHSPGFKCFRWEGKHATSPHSPFVRTTPITSSKAPLLQTYSIIFECFVVKLWKKALEQKYLFFFFDAFIRSACYSLIADRVGSALTGSLFFSSILGKYVCEETSDLSFHLLFFKFSEWANVIGLCSPFLLWVKCPFLSLWKPSGSATSISGRRHWCFMFELLLPSGNLRHYRLIEQNLWECTLCFF